MEAVTLQPLFVPEIPSFLTDIYLLFAIRLNFMDSLSSLFHGLTVPRGLTFSLIFSFNIPYCSSQLVNSYSTLVD